MTQASSPGSGPGGLARSCAPRPVGAGRSLRIIGLNRVVSGDRAKLMLDVRVQPGDPRTNYAAIAQLQLMLD